ncbi:hypothetical protein ACGFI9_03780 [Micromonospora sp. NPDC048930]|uniref:hypothetical protein n=1 Tax=Micromonospora sp. NPDC048930 TaxID=3364261 RepID=UPI00371B010D
MTRAVVGLAADVVDTSATLVKPVGSALQPVTEPIVEVLPPLLAPVLDLTQPIIGGPTAPPAAPDDPVVTPAPAADPSTTGMAGAIARPVPPTGSLHPKTASPTARVRTAHGDVASAGTGERIRVPRQQEPGQFPSVTPAASTSTAGSGSASGSAGIAAGASSASWSPDLRLVGHRARECGTLVGVSRQPDTRPA